MFRQTEKFLSNFDIPKLDRCIERGTSQDESLVGVSGSRTSRTPFDGVGFFRVLSEVPNAFILFYAPNLQNNNKKRRFSKKREKTEVGETILWS